LTALPLINSFSRRSIQKGAVKVVVLFVALINRTKVQKQALRLYYINYNNKLTGTTKMGIKLYA
jgi:hypothetical protein